MVESDILFTFFATVAIFIFSLPPKPPAIADVFTYLLFSFFCFAVSCRANTLTGATWCTAVTIAPLSVTFFCSTTAGAGYSLFDSLALSGLSSWSRSSILESS